MGVRLGFVLLLAALGLVLSACRPSAPPANAPPTKTTSRDGILRPPSNAPPRVIHGRTVRVRFTGNAVIPSADLRALMWIDKAAKADEDAPESSPREILDRDILLLNAEYYDRGYMFVSIAEPTITEATDGPWVDVEVTIKKEGPRMKIGRLTILERDEDGHEVPPLETKAALRRRITIADGGWFARDILVRDLRVIRRLYRDAGFANIEAEPETEVDEAKAIVDVTIPIRRGPLMRIENIEVSGNSKIATARILQEVQPKIGEPFHETKLEASRDRLEKLGVFKRVDIGTKRGTKPEQLVVLFEVAEK